jgi:WD40 repeat protein
MADRFTYDVFLSHNSHDKPRVRLLAHKLRAAGLRVWFDEWVIKPGYVIDPVAERALEATRAHVLCLSPKAQGWEWVMLERSTVLFRDPSNAGRRFIPLLLANCELPDALRRYKYVDYRRKTKAAFAELLRACRFEAETLPSSQLAVLERKLSGHAGWVRNVAVSPDGTWAASGSSSTVRVWDLENGTCRAALHERLGEVMSVAITPDGKRILSAAYRSIRIWDASSGKDLAILDGHSAMVWSVVALRDNTRALSGGFDRTLRLWELASGTCLKTIECGTDDAGDFFGISVDPTGTKALSGHRNGQVRLGISKLASA